MTTIKVDLTKQTGKIKPMHAVGQPPLGGKYFKGFMHYLTALMISNLTGTKQELNIAGGIS